MQQDLSIPKHDDGINSCQANDQATCDMESGVLRATRFSLADTCESESSVTPADDASQLDPPLVSVDLCDEDHGNGPNAKRESFVRRLSSVRFSLPPAPPRPWTHAWYHITVSVLGIPAASTLPFAFAYLGWIGGILIILFATAVSYISGILLINMQTTGMKSYSDIADSIFYPGFSRRYIRPLQFLVFVPVSIFTILFLGQTLMALTKVAAFIANSAFTDPNSASGYLSTTMWVLIAGIACFAFAAVPSIDRMWGASLAGSLSGVLGCVLLVAGSVVVLAVNKGNNSYDNAAVEYGRPPETSNDEYAFGILSAFGNVALAFGGHSVLPVMQTSLNEPKSAHAQASMRKGLKGAYVLLTSFYFVVPCVGYTAFGSSVQPNLMDSLLGFASSSTFSRNAAPYFIVLYATTLLNQFVMGGIYIQAGYALIQDIYPRLAPWGVPQLLMRVVFVGTCTFVAIAIPFFGALASLTGSLGLLALTFVVPYLLWLHKERQATSWKRVLAWTAAILCAALGLGGIISALYFIVVQASTYTFFS
jgi:amino acid permease